ncbi:DUF2252 domain-containing protein [Aggregicoccus sp. 17bor-14]|uniref:DUF2252 domain-containing protein n=1 Tax=Myxococcaceae TaxID=31 RepID=UPI00129CEE38|nr:MULTISPECIES: DUF2252 domain-containing protein [Myxococcaceae]MBF5043434.1 DUF2252 domain-containing protein [Simulacricoccus sp. 17bor-14]MRI89192.1 DUF2252 domain-containing protein [Aggregicoccus sp. 17bor-14]
MERDATPELGKTEVPLVAAAPTPLPEPAASRRRRPARLPEGDFRSVDERMAEGRALRKKCPRKSHAECGLARGRDPLKQLAASDRGRLPWLVPVRHERMAESAFAFLRGTPFVMAADLSRTPVSGLRSQICGDAHLANFGLFATAERHLVFDLNDFDETLPGPFEWDVKRLAASCVVAARQSGLGGKLGQKAARRAVRAYRKQMRQLAGLGLLEVWGLRTDAHALYAESERSRAVAAEAVEKARKRTSAHAVEKLTVERDGERHLAYQPPLLFPLSAVKMDISEAELQRRMRRLTHGYFASLDPAVRDLCMRYRRREWGFKVVGVGSVGMQAYVVLCEGNGAEDPLVLQVKEAQASVLEPYLGASPARSAGERVVVGQKRMQAGSDLFLGWTHVRGMGSFYVRQLRDMKGGLDVEELEADVFLDYADACGATLARAHARTGDAAAIAGYLGSGEHFDHAVADYACSYADQVEQDAERFVEARRKETQALTH